MREANYTVEQFPDKVVLTDIGPWSEHPTITNDADRVVAVWYHSLHGRRLLYYDSDGQLTELLIKDGKLAGFKDVDA